MNTIIRLFKDYKSSINWVYFFVYYILFTVVYLYDGFTLNRFLGMSLFFVVISLIAWLYHYSLRRSNNNKNK